MRRKCAEEVQELATRYRLLPGLAGVRGGQDAASVRYAERIVKSFGSVGLDATIFELPANASRAVLHAELEHLNALPQFAAVMVQWPLPPHLGWDAILDVLDPHKDVDG